MSRLVDEAPQLERLLTFGQMPPAVHPVSDIRCEFTRVPMRDGVHLATDVYLPPGSSAPALVIRTPYGRASDVFAGAALSLARRGYVVICQDCRGTGDSPPDSWDCYVHERHDSVDLVEWASRQSWFDGFIGGYGSSYQAQTQWCMSLHPRMTAIVPHAGGVGIAGKTVRKHLFYDAYAKSVGKGAGKIAVHFSEMERRIKNETLASGFYNEPLYKPLSAALRARYPEVENLAPAAAQQRLWEIYCTLGPEEQAAFIKAATGDVNVTIVSLETMSDVVGHRGGIDAHMFPRVRQSDICKEVMAAPLMVTGWYDWALNDALETWRSVRRNANEEVRAAARIVITPSSHNTTGYHEDSGTHPELARPFKTVDIVDLILEWFSAVRYGATDRWPRAIYYLMGANEWRCAADWPPPERKEIQLFLGPGGTLSIAPPQAPGGIDTYIYDPMNPTPTVGGSIVSVLYPPGSVDVSGVHSRADVLTYTTAVLTADLDIVGPLRMMLYASTSAVDTDFAVRLSDVFPDDRAIQLQSGILRARFRNGTPELLAPGQVYLLDIDLWATANRFKAGHRLRIDISSADFPRFDRNTNRGEEEGEGFVVATQTIYRDADHPSHIVLPVLNDVSAKS